MNSPGYVGIDLTDVSTRAKHKLGDKIRITDGSAPGVYMYVQASGVAVTQYYVGIINTLTYTIGALVNQTNDDTAPIKLGIPQVTGGIPDGSYGWVWCGDGSAQVRVSASCAINVPLYTTATAGELDDATASAKLVSGLKLTTANGGASAAAPCTAGCEIMIFS